MEEQQKNKFREQNFVGRDKEIEVFRRILSHDSESPRVLHYYGIGGIGKTWMLEQIASQMEEMNVPVLWLNCNRFTLPELLKEQLRTSAQAYPGAEEDFRVFDQAWARLEDIRSKFSRAYLPLARSLPSSLDLGISSDTYARLQRAILRCAPIDSDAELNSLFVDARISPWHDKIPESQTPISRIRNLIEVLSSRFGVDHQNALVSFLRVLCDQIHPRDTCYQELDSLALELESHFANSGDSKDLAAIESKIFTGDYDKLLGEASYQLFEATPEKLTSTLMKAGLNSEESEFYAKAIPYLARTLVDGINRLAQRVGCVVLIIDCVEFVSNQDELWLRNHLIERVDFTRVLPVFAGRRRLDPLIWRDWTGSIHQMEVKSFSQEEAEKYLVEKRGIKSLDHAIALHTALKGIPLSLAIAAFMYNLEVPIEEIKFHVSEQLLEYLVERVPQFAQREEILISSIPRTITVEILELLFNDHTKSLEVYKWLKELYTPQLRLEGLVFHDVMRDTFVDHVRRHYPSRFRSLNQELAIWFAVKREQYAIFSSQWQSATLEYIYHYLGVDEDQAIQEVAVYFLYAQEYIGRDLIDDLMNVLENYPLQNASNRTWVKYCRAQLAFLDSRFNIAEAILRDLYQASDIGLHVRANIVTSLAVLVQYQGQVKKAIPLHEEGLQLRRQLNDKAGVQRSLTNLGRIYRVVRDWENSLARLEESRQIAEQNGDQLEIGRILLNTGYIAMYQGRWVDADRDFSEALFLARQGKDLYNSSKSLLRLGQLRIWEDRPEEASSLLHKSIAEYKVNGELFGQAIAHNLLGDALIALNQWEAAQKELLEAVEIFESPRINARDRLGNAQHSFGDFFLAQGNTQKARNAYLEAVKIRRDLGTLHFLPKSLIGLCLVELREGKPGAIETFAREAETHALRYTDYYQLARLRALQGHAALRHSESPNLVAALYTEAFTYALRFNGYALHWVLQSVITELNNAETNIDLHSHFEVLEFLIESCKGIDLEGLPFEKAECKANRRTSSMLSEQPVALSVLQDLLGSIRRTQKQG